MSRMLLAGMFVLGLSGCAANQVQTSANSSVVYQGDSKVVVYREVGGSKNPATVVMQDRIAGVLLPNQRIELGNCARSFPMSVHTDLNPDTTSAFSVAKGQTLYIKATEGGNGFRLQAVDSEVAQEEIKDNQYSNHAVNRYVPDCSVPTSTVIDLSSDVLFAFGQSTLSAEGISVINQLASDLKAKSVALKKVFVEGHTDRIGSVQGNMRLSMARAQTVANQLRAQGLNIAVEPRGMGSSQPVTTSCAGARATPALIECLAPDRRVRLQLIGVSETSK